MRLCYRILFAHQTAQARRITFLPQTRPATVLRSAQAIPCDGPSDPECGADRDPTSLDLFFTEKPALTCRQTGKTQRQWQQVKKLSVLLLQVIRCGCLVGHGVGSSFQSSFLIRPRGLW